MIMKWRDEPLNKISSIIKGASLKNISKDQYKKIQQLYEERKNSLTSISVPTIVLCFALSATSVISPGATAASENCERLLQSFQQEFRVY